MSTPTPRASLIGAALGPYAVEQLIGCGAVGAVYAAFDAVLNRRVALKVLLGSPARNPELVQRFRQEALAIAPLRHPNIVRIYEAGIREGTPFIAMELIEGEPLESLLARQEKLPWLHALHVARQVADALACAHQHNLVHRDVKPANILIDRAGRVRLTDFGLAQEFGGAVARGAFSGTVGYMAPEQCRGESPGAAADLFALGVLLYRMLTGRPPFDAAEPEAVIAAILHEEPPHPRKIEPALPDDVARLVLHLLQKDPARRPESARVVSRQIERLQRENGGLSAMPEALDAYIREQARVRMLPSRRVPAAMTAKPPAIPSRWLWAAGMVLIPCVAFLAGTVAGNAAPLNRIVLHTTPIPVQLQTLGEGMSHISAPVPGARLANLHWRNESSLRAAVTLPANTQSAGEAYLVEIDFAAAQTVALLHDAAPITTASGTIARRTDAGGVELARMDPLVPATLLDLGSVDIPGRVEAAAATQTDDRCALVVSASDGSRSLWEHTAKLGSPRRILESRVLPLAPLYSPDGRQLVFFCAAGDGETCLWLLNRDSHTAEPLVAGALVPGAVCFDPAGETIAVSFQGASAPRVELWSCQSRERIAELGNGEVGPEAWLEMEDLVALVQRGAQPAIVLTNRAGAQVSRLGLPRVPSGPASISPGDAVAAVPVEENTGIISVHLPRRARVARLEPQHAAQ